METYSQPPVQDLEAYFEQLPQAATVDAMQAQRLQMFRQRAAATMVAESVEMQAQHHVLSQKAVDSLGHVAVSLGDGLGDSVLEVLGSHPPVASPQMYAYRSQFELTA